MESLTNNLVAIGLWLAYLVACAFDFAITVMRSTAYVTMISLLEVSFFYPEDTSVPITLGMITGPLKIIVPLVAIGVLGGAIAGWWRIGPQAPANLWRKP